MHNSIRAIHIITSLLLATMFVACDTANTAYHKYVGINTDGWQNKDTLTFKVDTLRRFGDYTSYLCLRIQPDFPYRFLTLEVEQSNMPKGKVQRRKVTIEVVNKEGERQGTGITYHTHEVPLFTNWMGPGDSVSFKVNHAMARETMPSIMDVGIKLKR